LSESEIAPVITNNVPEQDVAEAVVKKPARAFRPNKF
jgi:hypothetical protein